MAEASSTEDVITLRIRFKSETIEKFAERYAADLSRTEVFVRTREPLAVGTSLAFDFSLTDGSPLLVGRGRVAFGSDTNSLVSGPKPTMVDLKPGTQPRFADIYNPNTLANDNLDLPVLPRSTTGNKTWDYNFNGMAHFGMYADFVKDVRTAPVNPLMTKSGKDLVDNHLLKSADYFFSMFQKIVTGDSSMPLMFLRIATGAYHWPRKACVGLSDTRTCMATARSLRLAGSVSSAKAARSFKSSSSLGQPNQAFSPTALM